MLPTALPFHFGQGILICFGFEREREREVREMGREGVGFDILFWGRNEEIDVIRLREYEIFFFLILIVGIFYSLKFFGEELMSGTLLNHF